MRNLKSFLFFLFVSFLLLQAPLWAPDVETFFFDVGQAKNALVHKPNQPCLIIDAGGATRQKTSASVSARIAGKIRETGNRVNIVLSHGHADHTASLPAIMNALERAGLQAPPLTARFFVGGKPADYEEKHQTIINNYRKPDCALYASEISDATPPPNFSSGDGDRDLKVKFLATAAHEGGNAANDSSLVTQVAFRGKTILFTGDATGRTTQTIEAAHAKSTVFDSDHHGSNTEGSNSLL